MFELTDSPAAQGGEIPAQLRTFLSLCRSLSMSQSEERALLSMSPKDWLRLRAAPDTAFEFDTVRLARRLDYAIPLLRRMLSGNRLPTHRSQ